MPSLSIAGALADGLERLSNRRAAALFVPLYLVQLAIAVGAQSQLAVQRDRLAEEASFGLDLAPRDLPLALDVPVGVAVVAWTGGFLLLLAVTVVALRAFVTVDPLADDSSAEDGEPAESSGETGRSTASGQRGTERAGLELGGLPSATASALGAGLATASAVAVGAVAFVLPGLYLAAALAFALPYVATARSSALESLRSSWRLTSGHRLRVFVVLLAVWFGAFGFSVIGVAIAAALGDPAGEFVTVAADAVGWLFGLAVLAGAFDRLEAIRAAEAARWAGVDDELLP